MGKMRPVGNFAQVPYPAPYDIQVDEAQPGRTPTIPQHPMRARDEMRNNWGADMAWTNSVPGTTNYKKRTAIRAKSTGKTGGIQQGSTTSAVYQAAAAIRLAVVKALAQGGN